MIIARIIPSTVWALAWAVNNLGLAEFQTCPLIVPALLVAERRQAIAWGQVGELQASKPQPQVTGPTTVPPVADLAATPPNQPRTTFLVIKHLRLHESSVELGSFTPGYRLPSLRD